ncbi:MAG: CDP-alcohol phosphatidyltransferase family protein [Deltaproteobacteria bacterium]|nr:CDP-alcohol phosphatidyltransferase family protein [Deltaproteobacteria bacterium]
MNLPNTLTILRILSIPVFTICLLYDHLFSALLIFVGAGITDALDGLIARLYNQRTTLGAYLDPIADKLLLTTAFVGLAILGIVPGWLTVIVIARDVVILLGILILILTSHKVEINPIFLSKITTVFQTLTIIGALLTPQIPFIRGSLPYLIWLTTFLTCFSGFQYIHIGSKLFNEKGG